MMKKIMYLLVIFVTFYICSYTVYAISLYEFQKTEDLDPEYFDLIEAFKAGELLEYQRTIAYFEAEKIEEGEIIQYSFTENDFKSELFYTNRFPKTVDGLYVKIYKIYVDKDDRFILLNGNTDIEGEITITLNDPNRETTVVGGFNQPEVFKAFSYNRGTYYIIVRSETMGSFILTANTESSINYKFVNICVLVFVIIIAFGFCVAFYGELKYNNDITASSEEYSQNVREILQNQDAEDKSNPQGSQDRTSDILNQMALTLSEMKEYRLKSDKQMNLSFRLAIVLIVFGIFFISVSFVLTIINNKFDIVEILSVITGSLMELMGGGCLIIYKKSLEQIRIYYQYLHENEPFIFSVYLIDKLDDEKRNELYEKIIELKMKNEK